MTFRLSRRGLTIYDKLCHALIHLVAPTPSDVSQLRVGAAARGNVTTDVNPSAHSIHKPSDVGRPEAESLVNPIRAWALAIRNVALTPRNDEKNMRPNSSAKCTFAASRHTRLFPY
jgi:hypothetical protein